MEATHDKRKDLQFLFANSPLFFNYSEREVIFKLV